MKQQKTSLPSVKNIKKQYFLVDAADKPLGRLASNVARVLLGKHKPTWTPFLDTGDFVIVVNAGRVRFTGKKLGEKKYYKHSGYLGGLKEETALSLLRKSPETVIKHAVQGMLPKGPLGRKMLTKLKIYGGAEHRHAAQKPVVLQF